MSTPTLQDDRIDAMRSSVMAAVDADVRTRGRRTRRLVGSVAAVAVVVVAGGIGASLLSGPDMSFEASDSGASSAADSASGDTAAKAAPPQRQVVRTGSATVVVTDPRREADRIVQRVEALDGRIDARSEFGGGQSASADLTVRVPASQLTRALDQLSDNGDVRAVSLQNDDVTDTARDLDARIRALGISIDRLEKILATSDTSADVVAAESALTQRQSQLEELTSQRDAISDDVDMARLDISLVQSEQVDDVDAGGFLGGLATGWNALIRTVNGVVEAAGAVLPWAAVALVGYGLVRLTRRVRQRRTARSTRL